MTSATKISFGVAGIVLLAGFALAILGSRPPSPRTFEKEVTALLPTVDELPGWSLEFKPIVDSPEMQAKVTEFLNFEDARFAIYRSSGRRLSVYVAYWPPGRMSYRLIAGHTPDVCWVNAGWTCLEARSQVSLLDGRGRSLLPTEVRAMKMDGGTEHVVFWHLLDGAPMTYGTRGLPPWHAMITDLFTRRLDQKPEQFFIRISSNEPLEEIADTLVYRLLMDRLTMLRSKN